MYSSTVAIRNRGAWGEEGDPPKSGSERLKRDSHLSVVIIAMCAILVASEITSPKVAEEFNEIIGWFLRYTVGWGRRSNYR